MKEKTRNRKIGSSLYERFATESYSVCSRYEVFMRHTKVE